MAGLAVRRRQIDFNDIKYQINILKHHFIIFVTLFLVYTVSIMNIISMIIRFLRQNTKDHLATEMDDGTVLNLISTIIVYTTLMIQVTIQTYLLRLQGKKMINMTHVFSLLAIANFSLWMIDISNIVYNRHLWPIQWRQSLMKTNFNTITSTSTPGIYQHNDSLPMTNDNNYFNNNNHFNGQRLILDDFFLNVMTMFVPINRFYCSLIFFHFWKMKI